MREFDFCWSTIGFRLDFLELFGVKNGFVASSSGVEPPVLILESELMVDVKL